MKYIKYGAANIKVKNSLSIVK